MEIQKQYAKTITNAVFPNSSKKKKLSREFFEFHLETTYLAGQIQALEILLKMQKESPCSNAEGLIGDIQIKLVDTFNTLNKNYNLQLKELDIETLL